MKGQIHRNFPDGFNMTELGPLPQEWGVVRLGEVIIYKKGKKPQKLSDKWDDGFLPYLIAEFFRTGKPDKFVNVRKETGVEIVNPDDIVFIWDGSKAGDTFTGLEGVLASTMIKIDVRNKDKVSKKLIYYFLKTKFDILNTKTTGSTIPHVSKTVFENLPIPLPPLPEQRKIAAILSTVQKAFETENKLIECTKELKKAMMHKLFTEGTLGEKQKMTEIGTIPESWDVVRLGECLLTNNDFRFLIDKENIETVCFIPMSLIPQENLFISQFENRKVSEIRSGIVVYENDLLIAKITPCFENGKQGIVKGLVNGWGYATTEVIPIRVNEQTNLKYIAYYLKYPKIRNFLADKMEGSTGRQRLPKSQIENLKIPLPPLLEQRKIADILSAIDQKIEFHSTKKQKLEDLFRTLLHELMTAKRRVDEVNLDFLEKQEEG